MNELDKQIEIRVGLAMDEAKNAKTFGELRRSIKDMKGIALSAGVGSEAFNEMTDAIGSTNLKIRELNAAIMDKSGPALKQMVKAVTEVGQVGVAGFEVATGAMTAFGDSSDEAMKKIVKLQGIMVLGKGLSELSEAPVKLERAFSILSSTAGNFYNMANTATLRLISVMKGLSFQGIISGIAAFGTAVITGLATAGTAVISFFSTLDVLIAANPFGAIVIAITLIIGALSMLLDNFKPLKMLFEGIKAVIQDVIQAVKDFLDFIGLTNFAQEDAAKKTIDAKKKEKDAIESRYKSEIDIAKASGKEVSYLEYKRLGELKKNAQDQIETYKALEAAGIELTDEQKKGLEEQMKNLDDASREMAVAVAKGVKEVEDIRKKAKEKQVGAMKNSKDKNKEENKLKLEELRDQQRQEQSVLDHNYQIQQDALKTDEDSKKVLRGVYNKASIQLRKSYNAEVEKLSRDLTEGDKKLDEEEINKLKKKLDEKYELIITGHNYQPKRVRSPLLWKYHKLSLY